MAPGPGRPAPTSMAPLSTDGMQNTDASFAVCGWRSVRLPPGAPVSLIHLAVGWPNAPPVIFSAWPGQKLPASFISVAVPLVSGLMFTVIAPVNELSVVLGGQSRVVLR